MEENRLAQMLGGLFFLLLMLAGTVVAQAVFGNMTGTVTDPSGAAIPDLVITIQDLERGISYESKTNASGNFTQTHLISGLSSACRRTGLCGIHHRSGGTDRFHGAR